MLTLFSVSISQSSGSLDIPLQVRMECEMSVVSHLVMVERNLISSSANGQ